MFQMHLIIFFAVISISQLTNGYFYTYSNPPLEEARNSAAREAAAEAMKATPLEIGFLVRIFDFKNLFSPSLEVLGIFEGVIHWVNSKSDTLYLWRLLKLQKICSFFGPKYFCSVFGKILLFEKLIQKFVVLGKGEQAETEKFASTWITFVHSYFLFRFSPQLLGS